MITRQLPGGSAESFGPTQAVTIEEALRIFTENAARQEGLAHIIGRIDVGMIADLIVIDKNPYEISAFEIHKIKVSKTIIEGEIVYESKQ